MFQSLRLNSLIFVFHKDLPLLEIGYITSVSIPKPKYAVPPTFGLLLDMVVDVVAKINGATVNYNGLPAGLDIADSYSNGESISIADNREAMNAEILACKLKSLDIIASVDTHKKMINLFDKILEDLNPEYAEKLQQLNEINLLKGLMNDITSTLTNLTLMIEKLTKEEKI